MASRAAAVCAGVVVALALVGCTSGGPSAPDASPTTAPLTGSPTSSPETSSASRAIRRVVVTVAPADAMPATWRELFVVPYGPGRDELGTSLGGDRGARTRYGPESGAAAPDGSWWFLDVAKQRLAHYDERGRFIDAVTVPPRLLVDRRYFQWQLPHVLADGTLVAFRLTPGGGGMLRLRDGVLDEVPLTGMFSPTYDDGTTLYGSVADGPALASLDPDTGQIERAAAYRLPSGDAFTVTDDFDHGALTVETPTSATLRLATRAASGGVAHLGVQVRAGADGSVCLYLAGATFRPDARQLVGYLRIDGSGAVTKVESLASPFSSADRGSGAQLVVAPGGSAPMLVYVMPDGVHVYRRAA